MSNETEQRKRVMAWAQDAVDSQEIDELRQQIAEFAQERGNFARTIFELRGTIEQGKAANEAQIHEIGNLRDHSYKQADRIKELQEDRNRHKKFADVASMEYHKLSQEVTRLREALDEACEIIIVLTDDDESDPRIKAWRDKHTREALAGAKGAESETNYELATADRISELSLRVKAIEQAKRLTDDRVGGNSDTHVGADMATPLSEPLELDRNKETAIYPIQQVVDGNAKRIEQRDAEIVAAIAKLEQKVSDAALLAGLYRKEVAAKQKQINALEERIDFHAVNNPLNGNPDDISLHELISVVDQRCALIEQVLGGMTEEATFEKIDKLTEAVLMLLDEHKADKRGMRMWGSGDFERMANKLRE